MGIDVGSNSIGEIYYGNDTISEVYYGNDLVWSGTEPVNYIFRDIDSDGNLTLATGVLENADNITKIAPYGLAYAFYSSTGITGDVVFNNLTTIDVGGLIYAFGFNANIQSVRFPKLIEIKTGAFMDTFDQANSTVFYFNAFTSDKAYDNVTNMNNMITVNSRNCIIHFPSNLQALLENHPNITSGFNGRNTTILFDLPATS